LSEGSVARRLQVANVSRRFPQILVALAENRISLTVAGHLAPHLREDNVGKLLSDCAGMTKRAVEEYLVALRPKPVFNPSIRKRPAPKPECNKAQPEGQKETVREREQGKESCPAASTEERPSQPPPSSTANVLEPARPDTFNFRFAADGNFKAKFERLAEVLGVENPLKNMAEVFERAVDTLDKKDPKRKRERRLKREHKQATSGAEILYLDSSDTSSPPINFSQKRPGFSSPERTASKIGVPQLIMSSTSQAVGRPYTCISGLFVE
jgi:hypothetical protein